MNNNLKHDDQFDIVENAKKLEIQIDQQKKRISSDRIDISFGEIISLYKNKELIIQPKYQHSFHWSIDQRTALIESILLGIPIPPIFVSEDKDGIWELIDGLQRVSTFLSFFGELENEINSKNNLVNQNHFSNNWMLKAGKILKDLEGFTIDTLPMKLKLNLKRAICRIEILRGDNDSMKYELFKRLHSNDNEFFKN